MEGIRSPPTGLFWMDSYPQIIPREVLPRMHNRQKTYRVEFRSRGQVTGLGELLDVPAHYRSLDPYLGRLARQGLGGELALIDAATGATVARRTVRPPQPSVGR
jgi:hypothetical protein